jgi:G:T/U-mismatch repair DNA glycosylase
MTSNEKAFDEQKVKTFCTEKKIWIGDTAKQVIRLQGNASDDTLQVIQSFDIVEILQSLHHCTAVVVTGKKAMDTLMSVLQLSQQPAVWCSVSYEILWRVVKVYRMPSTSRAYPKPLAEKAEVYKNMFYEVGIK